jgi:predicted ATPase
LAARDRWREAYQTVLERASECHARLGEYDRALERCEEALKRAPLREGLYRQKMLYHSLAGQPEEALKTYADCVKTLKDELNLIPSSDIRILYEQILRGEHAQEAVDYPAHASQLHHNLPLPVTSFIGREWELAEVKELLAAHQLVTLTGAGGCGKSRLALQVAADLAKNFAHGVCWVELAPLFESSDLVPSAVATALGVVPPPDVPVVNAISNYLNGRQLLLVLDGCEHLVEICASLVSALLRTHPTLKVLVTSRSPLGIEGEVVWRVPPLSLPDPGQLSGAGAEVSALLQYDAVRLFVKRASLAQPGFALTSENAFTVISICRALDGLPLAIELAAKQLRVMCVNELAARLDAHFFELLGNGSRTILSHHQSLRASLDWSFRTLLERERICLERLAGFKEEFTFAEIMAVHGEAGIAEDEIWTLLTGLVDKSLVLADTSGEPTRYRLLGVVRRYVQEALRESGDSKKIVNSAPVAV